MISAALIARNDNYGGNLIERATYCLNSLLTTFDEVLYVDWNSQGKNLIEEIKDNLIQEGKLRYYVITPSLSARLTNNAQGAHVVGEVLARNIGIRRARGEWILNTNIDIIVPSRKFIESNPLSPDTFYTMARRHITLENLQTVGSDIQETLNKTKNLYPQVGPSGAYPGDKWSLINCCGDFQFASREIWHAIRGYEEKFIYRGFMDSNVQKKAALSGFKLEVKYDWPVFHIYHKGGFGGGGNLNNLGECLVNFKETENGEGWGFINEEIEEHIL